MPECRHIVPCGMQGRTLCALDADAYKVGGIAIALNRFVRRLGPKYCRTGDVLMMFEGRRPQAAGAGPRPRKFLFLTCPTMSPMYQDFAWCRPVGSRDIDEADLVLPLDLEVDVGTSRLVVPGAGHQECLRHCTSDELGKELLQIADEWSFCEARYIDVSVMQVRLESLNDESREDCKARGPQRQLRMAPDVASALDDLDAMEALGMHASEGARRRTLHTDAKRHHSARPAVATASPAESAERRGRSTDLEDDGIGWDEEGDESGEEDATEGCNAHGELDSQLLAWVVAEAPAVDEMHQDVGADDLALVAADLVPEDLAGPDDPEITALAEEATATVFEDGGILERNAEGNEEPPQAGQQPQPEPQQAVDSVAPALGAEAIAGAPIGCSKTASGYVFDSAHKRIGRVTRFGPNISCKCYMHSGKSSVVKGQKVADDAMILRWLQLGQGVAEGPSSSSGPSPQELTKQHMALWAEVSK